MSAACAPFSTARSMAARATSVFPLPTSPMSSRCIGRSRARSSSIAAIAFTWYAGELERQRPAPAVHHHPAGRASGRAPRRPRAAPAAARPRRAGAGTAPRRRAAGERRAPRPRSPESGTASRTAGRSAKPSSTRRRAGSGSAAASMSGRTLLTSSPQLRWRDPLCGGMGPGRARRCEVEHSRYREVRARSPRTDSVDAACREEEDVPSVRSRAIHGWLNQTATSGPESSNTRASTRFCRRLRIGRMAVLRTATATVASSPTARSATRRTSRRSRCECGKCSTRSASSRYRARRGP